MRNLWLFFLLLSARWTLQANADENEGSGSEEGPIVKTLNGPIRGINFKLPVIQRPKTDIDSAHIYLGVPYAQPPLRELRLEVSI